MARMQPLTLALTVTLAVTAFCCTQIVTASAMQSTLLPLASLLLATLLSIASPMGAAAADASEWKQRMIYQLLTDRFARNDSSTAACADLGDYCGGSFAGMVAHLDYIVELGFDAVWISPVVANQPGAYHGYAAQDLYTINPMFGGEQGLKAFVKAAHDKGVFVMVDVVANHMGIPPHYDYSGVVPFNKASYYHPCNVCPENCWINDFSNLTQVQLCQLDGLPDLDQSNDFVAQTLLDWVSDLVRTYAIDGLRVDTVPEVDPAFWARFQSAAGVYAVGEVFNGDTDYVAPFQGPLDAVLSYPLYFLLRQVFNPVAGARAPASALGALARDYARAFVDTAALGTFLENHDNPRFLTQNPDVQLYRSALLYTFYSTGIPINYYGAEQLFAGGNDPLCRAPLWTTGFATTGQQFAWMQLVVKFRQARKAWVEPVVELVSSDRVYAFSRGSVFVAVTNDAQTPQQSVPVPGGPLNPYKQGDVICNLFWPTQDCVTVGPGGSFTLNLLKGEQKLYDLQQNVDDFVALHPRLHWHVMHQPRLSFE